MHFKQTELRFFVVVVAVVLINYANKMPFLFDCLNVLYFINIKTAKWTLTELEGCIWEAMRKRIA